MGGYDWALHRRLREMQERDGSLHKFYCWKSWVHLRQRILAEGHRECVDCLAESPARYTPADCVHHVHEVEDEPGWALSEWATLPDESRERNLVPLCHRHHDERHGRFCRAERSRAPSAPPPLTVERW